MKLQNRNILDKVLKFGGSSLGSPDRVKNVIEIIKKSYSSSPRIAIVVSAFGGVTDQLIALGTTAAKGERDYENTWMELMQFHKNFVQQVVSRDGIPNTLESLDQDFNALKDVLDGVFLIKELSSKTLDLILSFGERLSAFILNQALQQHIPQTEFVDARKLIKTDRSFNAARVDFDETNRKIQAYFSEISSLPIITGFIGSTSADETTTLGRGGSDFTAAIIGSALNVKMIEIWTDVDGVMTADPRKEPNAFPLPEMSYKEVMEMSHFGAKVIHPPTITPVLEKNIPLLIKNTFCPDAPGTFISNTPSKNASLVCGISSIDHVTLLSLQGTGMIGICGISKRLFGALAEKGISVILISQGSSEQSICFAIFPEFVDLAREAIENEFSLEMQAHIIDSLIIEQNLSVIALVGENMRNIPGISGKFFSALGRNKINVVAIAQGSSEFNISVVIKKEDEIKAINLIHEAFFFTPRTTLNVFLIGAGLIGKTLLKQIEEQAPELTEKYFLDIHIVGLANSKNMIFNPRGIQLKNWNEILAQSDEKMDIESYINRILDLNLVDSIFVDCTSSEAISNSYENILNADISIVTPNKKANSSEYAYYKKLKDITTKKGSKFLYEANVGAGLPVISTINEMVRTGDKILKIEAILSGTLSYLFNSFNEKIAFSELIKEAQKKGYTEPDPREDIGGMDVIRKMLILGRESGYPLEIADISIKRIVPDSCLNVPSLEDFYEEFKRYDEHLEEMRKKAEKEGKVLRYIATFEKGKGDISLRSVSSDHPFYHLSGSENIIAITSKFYRENPMILKGPGAGKEVTAGKVFGEIIELGLKLV